MKIIELIPVLSVGFSIVFLSAKGDPNHTPDKNKKNMTLLEGWQNLENVFKNIMKQGVKKLLPMLTENFGQTNLSKECIRDTMHLISGVKDLKPWAMQFLDSSAKLWDGLLTGTVTATGSYDECLNIKVNSTRIADKGKRLFNGQYCNIDIRPPTPSVFDPLARLDIIPEELLKFSQRDTVVAVVSKSINYFRIYSLRLGICTPTGCSRDDINGIVSLLGDKIGISVSASRCEVKEENKYTPVVIGVITYYIFLTLLLIAGTLIGAYVFYTKAVLKSTTIRILLAFSLITNFNKFSNRHTKSNELNCLYGLRFLTMTSVILGHSYLTMINRLLHGGMKLKSFVANFFFQVVANGTLAVDVYFFLTGLLVCHILLTKVKTQNYKLNIWMYVIHRLWRILPGYSFIIMFSFLMELFGSGPLWYETVTIKNLPCYYNWWTNLIFINNFYDSERMCFDHTWYVAAEFQLYLFALVILIPMFKWPKVGMSFAFLTIITCILYSSMNAYVMNHPPIMLANNLDREAVLKFAAEAYFKPMTHAGPYAVGMLTGYILVSKPKLKISSMQQVFGWCAAISFSASTLYGTYRWNNDIDPTVVETLLYAGLARTVYTLGIAWMIICCATGHADIINYILSWKIFIPLGRITFLAYLIHPIVMVIIVGNMKTVIQTDHFINIWLFFGHLCVSYCLAFIVYMLVELPFTNLEAILLFRTENEENVKVLNENKAIKEINQETDGKMTTVALPPIVESCKL